MSEPKAILFPVGRLVQGSLYEPQTTNADGDLLIYKSGPKEGQPRPNYYFGLAIKKQGESHWNQTSWGAVIWQVGQEAYPNGLANAPTFAWKIVDGDSTIPLKPMGKGEGKAPCEKPGYPGNWIINFSYPTAPKLWRMINNEPKALLDENFINLGDYIEVHGNVLDNKAKSPGVYMNHEHVCFVGYGDRITFGTDVKRVGFGQQAAPAEAKTTPAATFTAPAPAVAAPPPPKPTVTPHPDILKPKTMTAKANGASYDDFIKLGWDDAALIAEGYLLP